MSIAVNSAVGFIFQYRAHKTFSRVIHTESRWRKKHLACSEQGFFASPQMLEMIVIVKCER